METQLREEVSRKLLELAQKEYPCSQMLMLLGLEQQGKANWDLVRAVDGLKGGLGFAGKTCGALTGGVCLLGLYAGRGPVDEEPEYALIPMTLELVDWFEEGFGKRYGGIDCEQITEGSPDGFRSAICRPIILETYLRVIAILEANGFDIRVGRGKHHVINADETAEKGES